MRTTHVLLEITAAENDHSGVLTIGNYYTQKFNTRELRAQEIAQKFSTFPLPGQPWDITTPLKTTKETVQEGLTLLASQLYLTTKTHRVKTTVTINGEQPKHATPATQTQITITPSRQTPNAYGVAVTTHGSTIGTKHRRITKTELQTEYREGVNNRNSYWSPVKAIIGLPGALKCAWEIAFQNYWYEEEPFTINKIIKLTKP